MQALRQVHKVKNGIVTIDLPDDFDAQEVEVIILPKPPVEKTCEEIALQRAIQKFMELDTSGLTVEQKKSYDRNCQILKTGIGPDTPRIFGIYEGFGTVSDDFDSLSEEEIELFYADNIFPE